MFSIQNTLTIVYNTLQKYILVMWLLLQRIQVPLSNQPVCGRLRSGVCRSILDEIRKWTICKLHIHHGRWRCRWVLCRGSRSSGLRWWFQASCSVLITFGNMWVQMTIKAFCFILTLRKLFRICCRIVCVRDIREEIDIELYIYAFEILYKQQVVCEVYSFLHWFGLTFF